MLCENSVQIEVILTKVETLPKIQINVLRKENTVQCS